MTPFQFVKAECSNFIPETSGCKGIIINDDLSMARMSPIPAKCLVADNLRCAYFEQCVIPLAAKLEKQGAKGEHESGEKFDSVSLVAKMKLSYTDATQAYRKLHKLHSADDRPCPICGRAMEPKKQFCEFCIEKRRKESFRKANRNRRSQVQQSSVSNS